MAGDADVPFTLPVDVRALPPKGRRVAIEPSEAEREAIARSLDLARLEAFGGVLSVTPWRNDGVAVEGTLEADLAQPCVVTLEPVPAKLSVPVEATFLPEGSSSMTENEEWLDPEGEDAPEALVGTTLDLGALAVEFLSLALDPYPRADGASLPETAGDGERSGPFAALASLREGPLR